MIRPPSLKPGDTLGIVPPSKSVNREYIETAVNIFEGWGLKVVLSPNIYRTHYQFAGEDDLRRVALQEFLDNPEIKTICCARGGYGMTRIIDHLSFKKFTSSPKWVMGFSDITPLLIKIFSLGMESIHGPMPITFEPGKDPQSLQYLKSLLFDNWDPVYRFPPHPFNRPGTAEGRVIGGNISLLCHIVGTPSDFETRGNIFFLEETDEYLYRFDRMLVQLKRAGRLDHPAGLMVGHLTRITDNDEPFGSTAEEIIAEKVASFNYPLCFGAPLGHVHPNYPIPVGRSGQLKVTGDSVILSFKK